MPSVDEILILKPEGSCFSTVINENPRKVQLYPDSHPVEPRGFSGKQPIVELSKSSPNQARGQSQVIKENMTKSLGSMGWKTG